MAIIGALPVTLTNGTPNDATQVMQDLNYIASQVNANGAALAGGNTFTGAQVVPAGGGRTQIAQVAQVQDGSFSWCGTAGGTANALTLTCAPAIPGYAVGQRFVFVSSINANTAAATVAVSALAPVAIQNGGAALAANAIQASKLYDIVYDGVAFQLQPFEYNVNGLVAATAPAAGDFAGLYDISTNLNVKMTLSDLLKVVNDLGAVAPDNAADYLLFYDTSGAVSAKALVTAFSATATVAGVSELATAAETLTGTDATRTITPVGFSANASIAIPGYYKLPGGFIIQWGADSVSGSASVSFPIAFPTACFAVVDGHNSATGNSSQRVTGVGVAGFTALVDGGGASTFYWIAVGH